MELIYEKKFTNERLYGKQLKIFDKLEGSQVFVFYSVSSNKRHSMGLFEVLMDNKDIKRDPIVIDYGELDVPQGDENYNYGPLNLGGGDIFLLTFFDKFSEIKAYTMCSFNETLPEVSAKQCDQLPEGMFSLDPFADVKARCGDQITNANQKSKLEYICYTPPPEVAVTRTNETEPVDPTAFSNDGELDTFFVIVIVVVGIGTVCCCVSNILFCKYRYSADSMNELDLEADVNAPLPPEVEARLLEQQKKQQLTLLMKKLPKTKYSVKKYAEQQECGMCLEEFQTNSVIRETPCHHIFHEECVMPWFETKLNAPDCPMCRQVIKYQ